MLTPEFVAKEIAPHPISDLNAATSIVKDGAEIYDLHQVASVNGNKVTFKEPIMHEVEAKYNWVIKEYKHYENVGVEDIAFKEKRKRDSSTMKVAVTMVLMTANTSL